MTFSNLMTCSGAPGGLSFMGWCSLGWLVLAIILILCMVCRRQAADGVLAGMGYNFPASLILGLGGALVTISLSGSPRWEVIVGIIGVAVGGFGIGLILPSEEGDYE